MLTKLSQFYHSLCFKVLQTIAVIAFGFFAIYRWYPTLMDSLPIMLSIPLWGILLLFISQLFMYYCNAKIFYYPLRHRCPIKTLWRTAVELNFINTALPYGEGLGFLWLQRLGQSQEARKELRYTFILRYLISILTNNLLSLLAVIWIYIQNNIEPKLCLIVILVNCGFITGCTIGIAIIFLRFYQPPRGTLLPFLFWGLIYSIAEDASYWVIATSLGHPEFFPAIFVGTVAGDILSSFSPLPAGIGLYEVPMIVGLNVLGVELNLATSFTLAGRAWVLLLMLPIGFYLALSSSMNEGCHSILTALKNQQTIKNTDETSEN